MIVDLTFTEQQLEFLGSNKKYVVVTKGRRFGATRGMAHQYIIWCITGQSPLLWVDTINGNIDRYFERYFVPALKACSIPYDYNVQKKVLKICNGYIDFRSADNPSSIEGFGYKKIFLNEAGIILKNEYLYTNAILPMLMDYPDSQLISAGVPKGKYLKNGQEHPFYLLYERGINGHKDYDVFEYSSYDNPFLNELDVQALEMEMASMSEMQVQQEIYGKFIEYNGNNPYIYNFNDIKHIGAVSINQMQRVLISVDFNIDPLCAIIVQTDFINYCYVIDEVAVQNANIGKFVDEVKIKYQRYLPTCIITGDAMGKQRNIGVRDNYSNYEQIQMGLGLSSKQIDVKSNPTHENSRADCNYFLAHFPDFKVSDKCVNTIRDLKYVQADGHGSIVKENRKVATQQSDTLDCFVGETLIHTEQGALKISDILIGDKVLTRHGYKNVYDKWSSYAEVYEFNFSDGTSVKCTKDHKFYNDKLGFVPIFSLYLNKLSIWKLKNETDGSISNTTEGITGNIQSKSISMLGIKKQIIQDAFIDNYGLTTLGKLEKTYRYIIKTATHSITISRTLNWLTKACICPTILKRGLLKILNFLLSFKRKELKRQLIGTKVAKAGSGIWNTQRKTTLGNLNTEKKSAISVKQDLLKSIQMQDFATTTVSQVGEEKISQTCVYQNAKNATQNLQQKNIKKEGFVGLNADLYQTHTEIKVISCKYIGVEKVYDISVHEYPEFYANGMLVHNCFRYMVNTFFKDWISKHQKINLSLNYERQITPDKRIRQAINNLANNGLNA